MYTASMDENWWVFIVPMLLLCPVAFVLLRVLYTQVQAHLLEFMLMLIVSTLPMGVLLNLVARHGAASSYDVAIAVLWGLFPLFLVFAGSLWALSAAKRLGEERTWHRLGLLLAGWLFVAGIACLLIGSLCLVGFIVDCLMSSHGDVVLLRLAWLLPGGAAVLVAIVVESRCTRKAAAGKDKRG